MRSKGQEPKLKIKVNDYQNWEVEIPYPDGDGYWQDEGKAGGDIIYRNRDKPGTSTFSSPDPKKLITEAEVEGDSEEIFQILERGLGSSNQQVIEPADGVEVCIEATGPYGDLEQFDGMWESVYAASGKSKSSSHTSEELDEAVGESTEEALTDALHWVLDKSKQLPYTDSRGLIPPPEDVPDEHTTEVIDESKADNFGF